MFRFEIDHTSLTIRHDQQAGASDGRRRITVRRLIDSAAATRHDVDDEQRRNAE